MAKEKKSNKAINSALAQLEKRFGEKVVMKMGDKNTNIDTFSSGRSDLDVALGGGYAVGKIIEIYAESGCGKTGLALEAIASMQKEGGVCAIIDSEHALNTEYCEDIGVQVDELYISQPSYGEQAIEAIRVLVDSGEVDLIVVDSVAAMIPKAELEGESGEVKMGLQARMMSQACKLITGSAAVTGTTVLFINQLRSTIAMYGPSVTTTGGKALKFYATQRLEVKNKGQIREGEDVIGFKQHIKVVKNKVGTPFKTIDNEIVYGRGVDTLGGTIDALVKEEILTKKGSWFGYNDNNIAQGVTKLRLLLESNADLLAELEEELKSKQK